MKRRRAREYALQFLFQFDFTGKIPGQDNFKQFWADKDEEPEIKEFAENTIRGTLDNLADIDTAIEKAAEHWVLQRMATVDRNILRFAAYELLYCRDIPSAVTINEAIEIAKKYSTTESASFINGILDKIAQGIKDKEAK